MSAVIVAVRESRQAEPRIKPHISSQTSILFMWINDGIKTNTRKRLTSRRDGPVKYFWHVPHSRLMEPIKSETLEYYHVQSFWYYIDKMWRGTSEGEGPSWVTSELYTINVLSHWKSPLIELLYKKTHHTCISYRVYVDLKIENKISAHYHQNNLPDRNTQIVRDGDDEEKKMNKDLSVVNNDKLPTSNWIDSETRVQNDIIKGWLYLTRGCCDHVHKSLFYEFNNIAAYSFLTSPASTHATQWGTHCGCRWWIKSLILSSLFMGFDNLF